MPSINDFPARGRVSPQKRDDGRIVFKPSGTSYELWLAPGSTSNEIAMDRPISGLIRITARKVYTVPSGGNFISPIFGPPKIVQGRVKRIDGTRTLVVHAGTNFVVDLPGKDSSIDLNNGQIVEGAMVNVIALPGATFELVADEVESVAGQKV